MGLLLPPLTVREKPYEAPYMRVDEVQGDPRRGMRVTWEAFASKEEADKEDANAFIVFLLDRPWAPEPIAAAYAFLTSKEGNAALEQSGLPPELVEAIAKATPA